MVVPDYYIIFHQLLFRYVQRCYVKRHSVLLSRHNLIGHQGIWEYAFFLELEVILSDVCKSVIDFHHVNFHLMFAWTE